MHRTTVRFVAIVALLAAVSSQAARAQQSSEELARAAQNPLASMISLPFQNNVNFDVGPNKHTQNVLNVQPVVPMSIAADWNVVTRTIVAVISQPHPSTSDGRTNGIGDIQFSAFFSPKQPTSSGWIWGAGPVVQLRSATDPVLGQGK